VHLTISCDTCVARHSSACEDCVVTFFCGPEPDLELDESEAEAVAALAAAGLVPDLRYRERAGGPRPGASDPRSGGAETHAGVRRHPGLRLVPGGRPGHHH
jgi:hypothetical protein